MFTRLYETDEKRCFDASQMVMGHVYFTLKTGQEMDTVYMHIHEGVIYEGRLGVGGRGGWNIDSQLTCNSNSFCRFLDDDIVYAPLPSIRTLRSVSQYAAPSTSGPEHGTYWSR